jgi:hypothetical protein
MKSIDKNHGYKWFLIFNLMIVLSNEIFRIVIWSLSNMRMISIMMIYYQLTLKLIPNRWNIVKYSSCRLYNFHQDFKIETWLSIHLDAIYIDIFKLFNSIYFIAISSFHQISKSIHVIIFRDDEISDFCKRNKQ